MTIHRNKAAFALLLALSVVRAGPARADTESDRVNLMSQIRTLLREIKDKLDRVPGSSSSYEIDEAKSKASEVKSKAQALRDVKESDSTADKMSSYYPDWVDKFRESADYLKQMKEAQYRQGENRLWEKCQDLDRKVRETVDRYVDKNDPRGLTEIPKLAEDIKGQIEDPLRKADDTHKDMERAKGYAKNFSASDSEGWSDITSELRDAADAIWDKWRERQEATHLKCDDVAKGKYHPYVVKGMEKLADSDKSRDMLYERLDKTLEQTASYLDGLVGRSGSSELDSAIGLTDQLLSTLDTLKSARGEDDKAKKVSDEWPDKAKELRRSIEVLKLEKAQQFVIDRAPEKCKEADDELRALIQSYVGDPEKAEEGQQAITERAEKLGREFTGRLEAADKKREELERYRDEAMRFSFDQGKWRPVKDNLYEGAKQVYGYYNDKLSVAKNSCKDIALGVKNPAVVEGLKKLGDTTSKAAEELEAVKIDYDRWKKDRRSTFVQWYHDDTYAIRDAFCNSDEDEVDRVVTEIVTRAQNRLTPAYEQLESRAEELVARLDKIKGDTSINGKERTKLRALIKGALTRLQKSKGKGLLRGMSDPKIRSRVEYGKVQHKSIQDSICDEAEVPIDGGYIDCVKVSSGVCHIIEIKPNNYKAIASGKTQRDRYVKAVQSLFDDKGRDAFESAGKLERFLKCIEKPTEDEAKQGKKGKINLVGDDIKTYEYCPKAEDVAEGDEPDDSGD